MPYKDASKARLVARASQARYRASHPGRSRIEWLKRRYGVTIEHWNLLFQQQGYRCAACGSINPKGKNWHTDHNPRYQKGHPKFLRGILCHPCNLAATVQHTSTSLRLLADYLERTDDQITS